MAVSLGRPVAPDPYDLMPAVGTFEVRSNDLVDGGRLHERLTAGGGNQSPHLEWGGEPPGTRSFVVTCFDPDAPIVSGLWHWAVVDIPADVRWLGRGAGSSDRTLPDPAFHVRNDLGRHGYVGAAPPPGDLPHRYYFAVHAVSDERLKVEPATSPALVGLVLASKILARAVLRGTYAR